MNIALIADAFPPLRTSCALLWRDLALELVEQGYHPTVIIPCSELDMPWAIQDMQGVELIKLKAPKTKDINYVRRTINEFLMPFLVLRNLRRSPLRHRKWQGVVWYSPTIFWGPLVKALKKSSGARSYLVIRDIFPDWALDIGLMNKGLPYHFFRRIANYQYALADVIGVQSPANVSLFTHTVFHKKVEVLHNWIAEAPIVECRASILEKIDRLSGRTIFVYAGNMGVAQGMDVVIELAEKLNTRPDIGFLLIGRGSELGRLMKESESRHLNNIIFHDEIEPVEISGLFAYCHIGLVCLDPRHKTHNIPGKFLSYIQAGLPVLACINAGNDLGLIIENERVGRVCFTRDVDELLGMTLALIDEINYDPRISERCQSLSTKLFSPKVAVKQIMDSFSDITLA